MRFSKTFPKTPEGGIYTRWEEIFLTEEEEEEAEKKARQENISIMKECMDDAKRIFEEKSLKPYQTDIVNTAIALFEKKASHVIYHKERKAKDKFEKQKK